MTTEVLDAVSTVQIAAAPFDPRVEGQRLMKRLVYGTGAGSRARDSTSPTCS